MKKLLTLLLATLFAFSAFGVRKVSKIYKCFHSNDGTIKIYEIQTLKYDEKGRLIQWIETGTDENERWFKHDFNYIDDQHIEITGWSERKNCRIDVTLNENGLVETAMLYEEVREELSLESILSLCYGDGLMTQLSWKDGFNGSEDINNFVIVDGNPVSGWKYNSADVAYTNLPNKCGMAYLPFITYNSAWRYRSLALAGLQGYGSRNLPYSCNFNPNKPAGIINYELDEEGYVLSMDITNSYDGDGIFKFEYCEVASTEMISPDSNPVTVRGENGSIIIDGIYTSACVYDLYGSQREMTNLTPGLYIVTVDGNPHKILMR